jgi:hypothetical protein
MSRVIPRPNLRTIAAVRITISMYVLASASLTPVGEGLASMYAGEPVFTDGTSYHRKLCSLRAYSIQGIVGRLLANFSGGLFQGPINHPNAPFEKENRLLARAAAASRRAIVTPRDRI